MLTSRQKLQKRIFDIVVSLIGLLLLLFPLILLAFLTRVTTGRSGIFCQERIGYKGKSFILYKLRTLKGDNHRSPLEIKNDETIVGRWMRKTKIDEFPQLYNVLIGDMSIVGPRPDIPGYADELVGEDRVILLVRPGITGPATLKYKNEEELLQKQQEPHKYNDQVIWPDKVKINKEYVRDWSFKKDLHYIYRSIFKW